MTDEDRQRLEECIVKMDRAADVFYGAAVQAGNHAFIEFCGLMKEYIGICRNNLKKGIDFTMCNQHSGMKMTVESYQFDYLKEKMHCIFEGISIDDTIVAEIEIAAKE